MMILRITIFQRSLAGALVVMIFLIGEVVPARASWPPSPVLVASNVSYVLDTPAMGRSLRDRPVRSMASVVRPHELRSGRRQGTDHGAGPHRPRVRTVRTGRDRTLVRRERVSAIVWTVRLDSPGGLALQSTSGRRLSVVPRYARLVRVAALDRCRPGGDSGRIAARTETRFGVVFLWCFTAIYFAQYLVINLSSRQRDVMLPVLLFFAYWDFRTRRISPAGVHDMLATGSFWRSWLAGTCWCGRFCGVSPRSLPLTPLSKVGAPRAT